MFLVDVNIQTKRCRTKKCVGQNKSRIFMLRICRRLMKRVKRSEVGYLRFLTRAYKKTGRNATRPLPVALTKKCLNRSAGNVRRADSVE